MRVSHESQKNQQNYQKIQNQRTKLHTNCTYRLTINFCTLSSRSSVCKNVQQQIAQYYSQSPQVVCFTPCP